MTGTVALSKSPLVALIEQIGALVVTVVSICLTQHLYAELQHEPDRSWLRRGWRWWLDRRLQQEHDSYMSRMRKEIGWIQSKETVPEPEV